ncbi:MarR family transcriptional regulator [Actinoplanes sp. LDG1-06]|uniref:MarR family transcriptional regulator n=2 Tax=Paractinoplanes ovalisporus TaxID=2810368 RepID=A0ABS2A3K0_9ACTN|nr:MarR family transcriptional regulator [Actinoplanes ovalisporus]
MHATDAAAVVEIINAEQHGRPLTPARLAERVSLTTGATSILLNRLEQAGHIVRTREHTDRRIVTLHSTPAIHAAAATFYEPLGDQLGAVLADYSPAELDLIETAVELLRSTMVAYMEDS